MEKRYIGWGQLLLLLFMCRVFTLMTFIPLAAEGAGLSLQLTAAAVSSAIQAVILIPAVLLKDSTAAVLHKKNKFLGWLSTSLYLHFFLAYTVNSLLHFQSFLSARFFPSADSLLWLAVILIVCVYCGCSGIEALGRSAVLLFWIFIAAMAAMSFSSAKNFDAANLYLENIQPKNLFSAVMEDLARNGEIVAVAFLGKHVREKLRCGVYGLLAAKLVLAELVTLTITAVLGDFAKLTDYPFLALGTFGGSRFIQRSDSLYLIVWTITAVINIALFLHIAAGLIGEALPKLKFRTSAAALIVFAAAVAFTLSGADFSGYFRFIGSGVSVIILAGVLPLAALIISRRKVAEKKHEA